MALSPYTGEHRKVRFRTYDLEWYPGSLVLRLVGEYDGQRYRSYKTMTEFLGKALTHRNTGTIWFAHAGGLADVQFVLETLLHNTAFTLSLVMVGSSAIIVKVTKGRDCWTFCDSFAILKSKLSIIGDSIGIKKLSDYRCPGDCDHEKGHCIFYAPMGVLTTYNEQDCLILYVALDRLQTFLLGMGGSLKKTVASCAMHLFRSRYLHREIHTLEGVNVDARLGYVASRVEVFRPHCDFAHYYDVNSSFPHSMTAPQPGNLLMISRTTPDHSLYLMRGTVEVPESYLPPLPYRGKEFRVFFPTGRWDGWFMGADIEYLEEKGGRVIKADRVLEFEPFDDLRQYALELYERKATAHDPYERLLFKYLLNSLYGKFAERPDKEKVLVHPKSTHCPHGGAHVDSEGVSQCMRMITPGVFACAEESDIPHAHVPIAANITALSRRLLGRYLDRASSEGEVYYADTDSVITTATLETSDSELGMLKLEKTINSGTFLAPKLYSVTDDEGKTVVRAKGFPRLTGESFGTLQKGGTVVVKRMRRIRENLNDGTYTPSERDYPKRYVGGQRPKRCPDGLNNTRPWTVEEIEGR